MPRLLVISGADEGKQFELTDDLITLGRDVSSTIRLRDTEVSRRHAELSRNDAGYLLSDLQSANGTFVNNQSIQSIQLAPGDQVAVGQSVLVYQTGEAAPTADLSQKISLTKGDAEFASAIIKTVHEAEGSRIFTQPDPAWAQAAMANLRIMYEASQAVSHILDLDQLLDRILELIFRSIVADRGCFMLCPAGGGDLEPKAVRWAADARRSERIEVSHSIVDYVLRQRVGVLCSDAAKDARFNSNQSVVRLGIREVICVPMKGRHETIGVLYLDTQTSYRESLKRPTGLGKFTEEHLTLAIAIAHQAALAVEETRYHQATLQAERLAAIGQTIAALSHHIKNILQGLRSGNDILKMGIKDKNDQLIQQGWRIAERSQGKIYDLVMDMLSFSKERVPSVEPTHANELVEEILELVAGRAKDKGVQLEKDLEAGLPAVPMDSEGIHRALLNVIGNAIDAVDGRPGARVTVATRLAGDWLKIIVMDNGPGIPPNQLHEIFKPFVSSKGSRGTGLGLPVSRKILREHGGDLVAQSQLGAGSKFALLLPLKSLLGGDGSITSGDVPIIPPEEE